MNDITKKWGPVLEHINVPSEKIEKLSEYCEHHALWETSNSIYTASNFTNYSANNLPIAIKVLNLIDINKVEFLNHPFGTLTYRISLPYNDEAVIIQQIADFLNEKIKENNYLGIFIAISNIFENDEVVEIESSPDMSVFSVKKMLNINIRVKFH